MYEYAVREDTSQLRQNDPQAIQKILNEMAAAGWRLAATTSVVNPNAASRIYVFFEREKSVTTSELDQERMAR